MNIHNELNQWANEMLDFHLPRWNELPEIELYMDQLIILIERYLAPLNIEKDHMITPAMVNNYVKLKLLPPPIKKRYHRVHIAYLLAITLFKQVFSLSTIYDAITQHSFRLGEKHAYNLFCEKQELELRRTLSNLLNHQEIVKNEPIADEDIILTFATLALINKVIVQKTMYLHNNKTTKDIQNT